MENFKYVHEREITLEVVTEEIHWEQNRFAIQRSIYIPYNTQCEKNNIYKKSSSNESPLRETNLRLWKPTQRMGIIMPLFWSFNILKLPFQIHIFCVSMYPKHVRVRVLANPDQVSNILSRKGYWMTRVSKCVSSESDSDACQIRIWGLERMSVLHCLKCITCDYFYHKASNFLNGWWAVFLTEYADPVNTTVGEFPHEVLVAYFGWFSTSLARGRALSREGVTKIKLGDYHIMFYFLLILVENMNEPARIYSPGFCDQAFDVETVNCH